MFERDRFGRIIVDFTQENDTDTINVAVLDERFILDEFKHSVDINFKSLPNAVSAENFVMRKYNNLVRSITELYGDSSAQAAAVETDLKLNVTEDFFSNLGNLIDNNSDSLAAQKQKVRVLEQELEQREIATRQDANLLYVQSNEISQKDSIIEEKEKEIALLKQSIAALSENLNVANTQS